VLNLLQDHGLISDLCVTAADVPDCDAIAAMRLLIATTQQPSQQKSPHTPSHSTP
jgi:hypothetical protein